MSPPKNNEHHPDSQIPTIQMETIREKPRKRECAITFASVAGEFESPERKNEDRILYKPTLGLYAIFDGVGGSKGGAEASKMAAEIVTRVVETQQKELGAKELIRLAMETASQEILSKSWQTPEYEGMGTTAMVIKVAEHLPGGSIKIVVGYCGDSRLYIKRFDKEELEVTLDNSIATDLFTNFTPPTPERWWRRDNGAGITEEEKVKRRMAATAAQKSLSSATGPKEISNITLQTTLGNNVDPKELAQRIEQCWNQRNVITQSVGTNPDFTPNIFYSVIRPGDKWLLTTDGITDNLTTEQIAEILAKNGQAEDFVVAAQAVTKTGSQRAKPDDMSAMVGELRR